MEYNKNKLIKKCLREYYALFGETENTGNFVPEKINKKIVNFIYKNMSKKFKEIHIYYLLDLEHRGLKLGLISRFIIWWSGLRPVFELELKEQETKQREKQAKEQEKEEQDEQAEESSDKEQDTKEKHTEPSEEKEI